MSLKLCGSGFGIMAPGRASPRAMALAAVMGVMGVCSGFASADDGAPRGVLPTDTVVIDISGAGLLPPFEDFSLSSLTEGVGGPQLLNQASGYSIMIDGVVDTRIGSLTFPPFSGDIANLFGLLSNNPGANLIDNFVRAPESGSLIWREAFGGGLAGVLEIIITFEAEVLPTGEVKINLGDFTNSLGEFLEIEVVSGTATVSVWEASEPQLTEWHMDGDFTPAAGSAGLDEGRSGQIRYLDDAAFGAVLGGSGSPDIVQPSTPTGVTQAQSSFVDTAADPALPMVGDADDVVYLTSPSFNVSQSGEPLRRGIGLSMWPNLQADYPGLFIGAWSMVYDLLVPSSTFFQDAPNDTTPRAVISPLLNTNPSNEQGADMWLVNRGAGIELVWAENGQDFDDPPGVVLGVQPGEWFRLAVVCDEFLSGTMDVYVNGTPVGVIETNWIYNSLDPRDGERRFLSGTPIDDADWLAWGEFPSPWARDFNNEGIGFAISAGATLFADLRQSGDGPVYLANLAFVDEKLSAVEVAGLGGADHDGILLPKTGGPCNAADLDGNGTNDALDVIAFLGDLSDVNGDTAADFLDVLAYLEIFNPQECP